MAATSAAESVATLPLSFAPPAPPYPQDVGRALLPPKPVPLAQPPRAPAAPVAAGEAENEDEDEEVEEEEEDEEALKTWSLHRWALERRCSEW